MATAGAVKVPGGSTTRLEVPLALVRFGWAVVGYNVLVILWGALVRATGSGAGCGNHWPLCNGQVIPLSPRIDTIIEFTHRCMTGGSTFLVVGLLIWTFRGTVKGHAARAFAIASMLLLLNEAFLGALLVKLGYVTGNQSMGRVVVLSIHLSNTLLLLAALTLTARLLTTGQRWAELRGRKTKKTWALLGLGATLVVGVSGSLAALGDTLFPASSLRAAFAQDFAADSPWLLRLRGVHPVSAVIAAVFVLWLIGQAKRAGEGKLAAIVVALLAFQFALGLADVLLLAPVWMQILHLLGADLYWVALVALATAVMWPKQISNTLHIAN
ncbi:COX15/CtaA family protein [Tunturibacter psychrotolerans]|uniref:COX15/CtaA family protein n=1 Tax=Tunturiibacter psychrotolerans TaxID=3069686 RepID=A0AAU7ZVZ9_9BACT